MNSDQADTPGSRRMEKLTRGLVAMMTPSGVFMSWRFLNTDAADSMISYRTTAPCIVTGSRKGGPSCSGGWTWAIASKLAPTKPNCWSMISTATARRK